MNADQQEPENGIWSDGSRHLRGVMSIALSGFIAVLALFQMSCRGPQNTSAPPSSTQPLGQQPPEIKRALSALSQGAVSPTDFEKWFNQSMTVASKGFSTGDATVRALRGKADYRSPGGVWRPIGVGKVLKAGDTVRTEADSEADLFLRQNGPVVRVAPETTLLLGKMDFRILPGEEVLSETLLGLESGRILGAFRRGSEKSTYEIRTNYGLVRVEHGDYDVTASGYSWVVGGSAEYVVDGKTHPVPERYGEPVTVKVIKIWPSWGHDQPAVLPWPRRPF